MFIAFEISYYLYGRFNIHLSPSFDDTCTDYLSRFYPTEQNICFDKTKQIIYILQRPIYKEIIQQYRIVKNGNPSFELFCSIGQHTNKCFNKYQMKPYRNHVSFLNFKLEEGYYPFIFVADFVMGFISTNPRGHREDFRCHHWHIPALF